MTTTARNAQEASPLASPLEQNPPSSIYGREGTTAIWSTTNRANRLAS